jgi:DNA-binding beta-propeller fold protein YncE
MRSTTRQGQGAMHALKAVVKAAALAAPLLLAQVPAQAASWWGTESGQVRPLAMSPDKSKLFVVNTPNNTLDVFSITGAGLSLIARVPVGLEPVAVAARSDNEVWVVNHLSDSVSIVSLDGTPRVTRTLLVGDEPRDIVFAGSPAKAFITAAHRGQHLEHPSIASVPGNKGGPESTTEGVPRNDVWVFNPTNLGSAVGGVPTKIINLFSDLPRGLAVSPDNNTVYVAAHKSGNQTTSINEELVCDGFAAAKSCVVKGVTYPGGAIGPNKNFQGKQAPEVGIIVKFNKASGHWEDIRGKNWDNAVPYSLPDRDVFAVDANSLNEKQNFTTVGTTLFNMVANPVTGTLYVSNTEANNFANFEGSGKNAGGLTLQGNIAQTRITVIKNGQVQPRHLNKHLDYTKLANDPGFDTTAKQHSLATPLEMAVTKDGKTLYVTAYGSSKIGVYDTAELENNTFDPRAASSKHITVSGGGPAGVVLDEGRGQMYVVTRFDNAVKVINLANKSEVASARLPNPEPASVVEGRKFLYDAQLSSANGENSCSSCHIFGDEDGLAWNLGNPDDEVTTSPIPNGKFIDPTTFAGAKLIFGPKTKINGSDNPKHFHPLKGPMITQTLRGLKNQGAQHWRGDRSVGVYGTSGTDSNTSFINFGVAFEGLLGNPTKLDQPSMQKFADYMMQVNLPPNPIRKLDNSLRANEKRGSDFHFGTRPSDGFKISVFGAQSTVLANNNCNGCHTVDGAKGLYGGGLMQSFEGITQIVKVPQLRNLYQRVGRFGSPALPFSLAGATGNLGEQVRGYGFVHDGTADTLAHFFTVRVFQPTLNSGFPMKNPDATRRDVADFMLVMTQDLAPIVGQQVTLSSTTDSSATDRVDLFKARAQTSFVSKELGGTVTECDLVARVAENGKVAGYLYNGSTFQSVTGGASKSDADLRAMARTPGQEVTYTCAVPGTGRNVASAL